MDENIYHSSRIFNYVYFIYDFRLNKLLFICRIAIYPTVVERTKRCWDYCATLYILDLLFSYIVDGFPRKPSWWISHLVCLSAMIVLSELACAYFETLPIEAPNLSKHAKQSQTEKSESSQLSTSVK